MSAARPKLSYILLVEDLADLRDLIVHWLTSSGYEVAAAGSAAEAWELIERRGFPGVLATDQHLQGMTGLDFALRCRSLKPDLPVLIFSGDLQDLDLDAGMKILPKPFTCAQLLEKLLRLTA
ncbi:MAG: response regulator [Bryobacteraceae bacterium]|nr:response regulator [Bryobacteraceae bacterium]